MDAGVSARKIEASRRVQIFEPLIDQLFTWDELEQGVRLLPALHVFCVADRVLLGMRAPDYGREATQGSASLAQSCE